MGRGRGPPENQLWGERVRPRGRTGERIRQSLVKGVWGKEEQIVVNELETQEENEEESEERQEQKQEVNAGLLLELLSTGLL